MPQDHAHYPTASDTAHDDDETEAVSAPADQPIAMLPPSPTITAEAPDHLPISYLNALLYCQRRFYLEYVQGEMLVNEHVAQGRIYHKTADSGTTRTTEIGITLRRVYVYSDRLHIAGLLDVVEAPVDPDEPPPPDDPTVAVPSTTPLRLYPVEYKKGSVHGGHANDHVQLCAQGLCLEERIGLRLDGGFIFSFKTRHRIWIPFTADLRTLTEATIALAFALVREGRLPPPLPVEQERKCHACSLEPLCLPQEVRMLQHRASQSGR